MRLHGATGATNMVFEPAPRGPEGVAHGHLNGDVARMLIRRAADDDACARDADLDHDAVEAALVMMAVRRFHRHAAADDLVAERFEIVGGAADASLQRRTARQSKKDDLERPAHDAIVCDRRASAFLVQAGPGGSEARIVFA